MRRLPHRTTALAAVITIGLTAPVEAMPAPAVAPSGPQCSTVVAGVDANTRARIAIVSNGEVTANLRGRRKLGFNVTAVGLHSGESSGRRVVLRLNAVTGSGVPRRLTMSFRLGSAKMDVDSSRYDQKGFEPHQFADGQGFHAYTVNGSGVLQRWELTRFSNGDVRFADRKTLGGGYDDVAALQTTGVPLEANGAERDYLYATTKTGALEQIAVPVKKPKQEKRRTLLPSGYAGVTELSLGNCNGQDDHVAVVAINPVSDTATWTTVEDAATAPVATPRGAITGGKTWALTAAQ